jgi:hypothetical protein
LIVSKISCVMIGDRPIDGSSSISSRGRDIIARPIASICCSPPENRPAFCDRRSPSTGNSPNTRSMSARTPASSLRVYAPRRMFSSTVIRANTRRPSGECAIPRLRMVCAGAFVSVSPSNRMSPPRGRSNPEIVRSVVVFPAPFAPMRQTIWPASTVNDTSRTASIAP